MADTEFDGELDITAQDVRDALGIVWPPEMGLVNRITFEFTGEGPVVEVAYLGRTIDDIQIDMEKKEAITEVRRYTVRSD